MDEPTVANGVEELAGADGRVQLVLRGRLGTDGAVSLRATALRQLAAGCRHFEVVCSELEHIGGATLQVLLALQRELRAGDGQLVFSGLNPAVIRALSLTGVSAQLLPG